MSRRKQIVMTAPELARFLHEQRVVSCATTGPRGWPHVVPLWYVIRGEDVWAWTYAKSQKARNLGRDPRASLLVEAGESYHELRGVMIEAQTVVHRDFELVAALGAALFERYGAASTGPGFQEAIRGQAAKRVALQFVAERTASWDHRRLDEAY